MYEPIFSNISACEIANEVKTKGYFSTEFALTDAFPNTSLATMDLSDILELQKQLLPLTLQALAKTIARTLLQEEGSVYLKQMEWRFRQSFRKKSI